MRDHNKHHESVCSFFFQYSRVSRYRGVQRRQNPGLYIISYTCLRFDFLDGQILFHGSGIFADLSWTEIRYGQFTCILPLSEEVNGQLVSV